MAERRRRPAGVKFINGTGGQRTNKAIIDVDDIVEALNDNASLDVVWSKGHSKNAARVKAYRVSVGTHPAWKTINVKALGIVAYTTREADGTWSVSVGVREDANA